MNEIQRQIVDQTIHRHIGDPRFPAMIVAGLPGQSESEISIMLIATDAEFNRRKSAGESLDFERILTNYPGIVINQKVINRQFLEDAVERGSEATRAFFAEAWCAYTHLPGLEDLIRRIPVRAQPE